jgi:uncharacterized membrane protein YccC
MAAAVAEANEPRWLNVERREWVHATRTTVAAVASVLIARAFRLPESYWAAVTTMVVMQSTLGAALTVSKQRLAGTALGAAMGALLATYFGSNVFVFGAGLFALGAFCAALHIERNAFRYAGITLVIVQLVARSEPAWIAATHRFFEISVGIVVGLVVTAVWPEADPKVV